jgi:tetratricopeptide (TPR) repeat protein
MQRSFGLMLGLWALVLTTVGLPARGQQTAVSGKGGVSINAKGNARVAVTYNNSDPVVLKLLEILAEKETNIKRKEADIERRDQKIDTLQGQKDELNARLLADRTAAVVGIVERDRLPDATALDRAAKAGLERGDTKPAEASLREREDKLVAVGRGQLKEAAALARQSAALAASRDVRAAIADYERAASYDPEDPWTWIALGDVQIAANLREKSLVSYQHAVRLAKNALSVNQHDKSAQRDLSIALERVGNIFYRNGDLPAALTHYQNSLLMAEHMIGSDKDDIQLQRDLSVMFNKIGNVHLATGESRRAIEHYQRGLLITERLVSNQKRNTQLLRDLSIGFLSIADVLLRESKIIQALDFYQQSLEITEQLVTIDRSNSQWQLDLSIRLNKLGDTYFVAESSNQAIESYQRGLFIAEQLAASDQMNIDWQLHAMTSLWRLRYLPHLFSLSTRTQYLARGSSIFQNLKKKNALTTMQEQQGKLFEESFANFPQQQIIGVKP